MISACLLVYNHSHTLPLVINSILSQTYKEFELIVSDDNSTDNSFEIINSFAEKDSRIVPIRTPRNLGMAGNANFAITSSKFDYIALLHHDDILKEDTFYEWLKCIDSDDKIAFVFNDYKTKETESSNNYLSNKLSYINNGKTFLKNVLLKYWGCPVRGTGLIRKKCFSEVGGINEKFEMIADVDLWMMLSSKWDVGYVSRTLIEVLQQRPENYPKDYTDFSWKRMFILFDIHSNHINRKNFPNIFYYVYRRFVFRNKVSFEIIKWHIYAVARKKYSIIKQYPPNSIKYEYFYCALFRKFLKLFVKEATHRKD